MHSACATATNTEQSMGLQSWNKSVQIKKTCTLLRVCMCNCPFYRIHYINLRNVIMSRGNVFNISKSCDLNTQQERNWKYHAIIQMNIDGFVWDMCVVFISSALAMGSVVLHTHIVGLFPVRNLIVIWSRKISTRENVLTQLHRFEIWQDPRQRWCRDDYQISERLENCKKGPRAFEISRDLTIGRLELTSALLKTHLITRIAIYVWLTKFCNSIPKTCVNNLW